MSIEWGSDEGLMTWLEAVEFAKAKGEGCRLPTVAELVSMFDYDNGEPKDGGFQDGYYWSASRVAGSDVTAWAVTFYGGGTDVLDRDNGCRVRLVREVAS